MRVNNKIYIIFGLVALLMMGFVGIVTAEEGESITPDEKLLALINEARRHPLVVAASMGMNPDKLLKDLPELEDTLKNGLEPLTLNENLSEAAFAHTWDMFARGYYAKISPDGKDWAERINDAGYPAVLTGESLGMILFANFINPEDATRLIFEYMFKDELDPSRAEKRNILDPCLREAGISVQTGTLALRNGRWNVYLATCDFGSLMSCAEGELMNLINRTRKNPLDMAEFFGLDPEQVLVDFPEKEDVLNQGLPPLALDTKLAEAARGHAADMLENAYYAHDSLDGRTYTDRIREAGYDWTVLGERIELRPLCNVDDEQEAIRLLFKYMLKSELTTGTSPEEWKILNAGFTEVGIGVVTGCAPALGGICGDQVGMAVVDFGTSQEGEDPAD